MPQFHKRGGRWVIRFKKSNRQPKEQSESIPIDTPKAKVRHIEGKMNAAYYDDWDPWVEDWKSYQRRKQMQSEGIIDSGLTLKESIDVYIDKLSVRGRINSPTSENNYRHILERMSDYLKDPFMLADLLPHHAEGFLQTLDVKDSTFGEYASRISTFYKYWHGRGMIRETFEYNSSSNPREDKIKYITEAQKDKIITHYRQNRQQIDKYRKEFYPEWMGFDDILTILFYQGFRKSEVFKSKIRRKDVYISSGKVKVTGKGNKTRVVDITPPAQEQFRKAYLANSSPEDNLIPVSGRSVAYILKEIAKEVLGQDYSWLSLHNLRHSCGTYWAGLGVPIATIQKLLGHSSINTTMIYAKITDQQSKSHFESAYSKDTPITKLGSGNN